MKTEKLPKNGIKAKYTFDGKQIVYHECWNKAGLPSCRIFNEEDAKELLDIKKKYKALTKLYASENYEIQSVFGLGPKVKVKKCQ